MKLQSITVDYSRLSCWIKAGRQSINQSILIQIIDLSVISKENDEGNDIAGFYSIIVELPSRKGKAMEKENHRSISAPLSFDSWLYCVHTSSGFMTSDCALDRWFHGHLSYGINGSTVAGKEVPPISGEYGSIWPGNYQREKIFCFLFFFFFEVYSLLILGEKKYKSCMVVRFSPVSKAATSLTY